MQLHESDSFEEFGEPRRSSGSAYDELVARLRRAGCVFAEDEAQLLLEAAADPAELESLTERRVAGEPLEHLLGWAEFDGLRIVVPAGVFVPRRRSEILVATSLQLVSRDDRVVELCCGVAAVGTALLHRSPLLQLTVADIDPAALVGAAANLGGRAAVLQGDLYGTLPAALRGAVDLVVANAPYVPSDEIALMPSEAREHEPAVALDGGVDGLDLHRRIAAEAPLWLRRGGHLVVETSDRQASTSVRIFERAGFEARVVSDEEIAGTAVIGTLR